MGTIHYGRREQGLTPVGSGERVNGMRDNYQRKHTARYGMEEENPEPEKTPCSETEHAGVAQSAEALDSKSGCCRFESDRQYAGCTTKTGSLVYPPLARSSGLLYDRRDRLGTVLDIFS